MMDSLMEHRGRSRFIGNIVHRCVNCGKVSEEKLSACCNDSSKEDYQLSGFGEIVSYAGEWDGIFNFPYVTVKLKEGITDREGIYTGIDEPKIGKPVEFRVRLTGFNRRPFYNTPNLAYAEKIAEDVDFKSDSTGDEVGIRGWGTWLGPYAISTKEIGPSDFIEKRIAHPTEDVFTMSAEAAAYARRRAGCKLEGPGTILLGTEHKPTHSQPYSNIIATRINAPNEYDSGDLSAACLAGQNAFINSLCQVNDRESDWAITAWADQAGFLGRDDKDLTRFTGDGASVFEVGRGNKENLAAKIIRDRNGRITAKFSTYTRDYDVDNEARAFHGGRFTGEPGYFYHMEEAFKRFLRNFDLKPKDFKFAVFHDPNKGFFYKHGTSSGFTEQQLEPNLKISPFIGNFYSACVPLCYALEHSKPDDRIFVQKYGSGAQSRVTLFEILNGIEGRKNVAPTVDELIAHKKTIKKAEYDRLMKMKEQILGLA